MSEDLDMLWLRDITHVRESWGFDSIADPAAANIYMAHIF